MTYFTICRQSRCPKFGTLCSNGLKAHRNAGHRSLRQL